MSETNIETANTIREQIGHKAMFMMGARNFLAGEKSLTFDIMGSRSCHKIRVTLNGSDLYDLEFFKRAGVGVKTMAVVKDVYDDQLKPIIQKNTSLYLSL